MKKKLPVRNTASPGKRSACILGIDGGGTKTTWARVSGTGDLLERGRAGPGNTLLLDEAGLARLFGRIADQAGQDYGIISAAFAGCGAEDENQRVARVLRLVWPQARQVKVMEDTRSILVAAFGDRPGIAVIAGTGANVAGQLSAEHPVETAGGWGHLFGDRGSGYDLARRGLETIFARYDEERKITALAREYLAATGLSDIREVAPLFLRDPGKTHVASYARCVFVAALAGDEDARRLLREAAAALAGKVATIAGRLGLRSTRVALTGGLFERQEGYRRLLGQALRRRTRLNAEVFLCETPGEVGAALAAHLVSAS